LDNDIISQVRRFNAEFHVGLPAKEIQVEKLGLVIYSLPRKTPGPEKMEAAVIQKVWDMFSESVHRVLAKWLETNCFPMIWKRGEYGHLKKSSKAPSFNPSLYQPICLLPIFGKGLEKDIARKIREVYSSAGLDAPNQYGFKKGLSMVDAVRRVVSFARRNVKYIAEIKVAVTGTFDTLWWLSILARLRLMKCPANLNALVVDYLTDREIMIRTSHERKIREVKWGCLQGSVLGPL
jgi:hypothetical protein